MTRGEFYTRILVGAGRDHMLGLALQDLGFTKAGKFVATRSLAPLEKPTAAQTQAARKAATQGGV